MWNYSYNRWNILLAFTLQINKETFGYDEYPDNKVYINRWLRGGSPTDEVAKVLDCVAWKDMMEDDTCKREVDKYMYNLIVWNEKNEYFTKDV